MAVNLDNIDHSKNDPLNMLKMIEDFPALCRDAWDMSKNFVLPSYFVKANKFVIAGMGASGVSGEIIADLAYENGSIVYPLHDYSLPGWVDKDTLVIVCSYSGNTEESLSVFLEAEEKGARIVTISSGGKLKVLAEKFKVPHFGFDLKTAPRAAFPYLFIACLSIVVRLGLISLSDKDFDQALDFVEKYADRFKTDTQTKNNPAKLLAKKLQDKYPTIYAGRHLSSVGRRFKTQINENSKSLASLELYPELDHNAIEGYNHPRDGQFVVSLESNYDPDAITRRQNITSQILAKHRIMTERVKFVPCVSPIAELLTMVLFADYTSYYLGYLNRDKISENSNIDFLKSEMSH